MPSDSLALLERCAGGVANRDPHVRHFDVVRSDLADQLTAPP
jgi:hypothetical protein